MFELEKYLECLCQGDDIATQEYRMENIPIKLYKYVSLDNNHNTPLNKLKLKSILDASTWLSTKDNLNDPFELKSNFIDDSKLIKFGWDPKICREVFESIQKSFLVGSFTTTHTDNMPMWTHYASNHRGYCIEYEVINSKFFYKVSYENQRIGLARTIADYIVMVQKTMEGEALDSSFDDIMRVLTHIPSVKHTSWEYENEFRIVYLNANKESQGELVSNSDLGIKISKVYCGYKINNKNRMKLLNVCTKANVEVEDVYISEISPTFRLETKPVVDII